MDRYREQRFFEAVIKGSAAVVLSVLILVIGVTVYRGGSVLISDPTIMITPPGGSYMLDAEGGFLHAVVGSILIVVPATILSTVLAISTAVYLQSDYSSERFTDYTNTLLNSLWGTPPIIYGVFVLTLMIAAGARASLVAGIIAVGIFQYPIITRYVDEALQSAPEQVREATYGLGATRIETSKMMIKSALPGIVAGVIMGFARGIGDAATVLFTAGGSTRMPAGPFEPATTLPILIFEQAASFNAELRAHAYAASFLLITAVLLLILISKLLTRRMSRFTIGGNPP